MALRGTIIVPTASEYGEDIAEDVARHIADQMGGVSMYDGEGKWIDDEGTVIVEPHKRIQTVADVSEGEMASLLEGRAKYVAHFAGEDSVLTQIEEVDTNFYRNP